MFLNYLKTALRNMARRKGYTFINITGLALGMACCILILMYVNFELSYDRFNEKGDRIYRVICTIPYEGKIHNSASVSTQLTPILLKEFPEIENAVRFDIIYNTPLSYGIHSYRESKLIFTEPSIFDIFTIPLLIGNSKTALSSPNSIVISRKASKKYFGKDNPIGKKMELNNLFSYTVTGVFEDIPRNSHFNTDFFISWTSIRQNFYESMLDINIPTYILLKKRIDYKSLEKRFFLIIKKYISPYLTKNKGQIAPFLLTQNDAKKIAYHLQPLYSIHFKPGDLENDIASGEKKNYIIFMATIAFFILIIATINFINLSIGQSSLRAKEVVIRKTSGAFHNQLIQQFLVESILFSIISVILALGIAEIIVPQFNVLLEKDLTSADIVNGNMIYLIIFITLLTGLMTGIYPAVYLTSSQTVCTLKNKVTFGFKNILIRRVLVIFQLTSSLILIISLIVVMAQLDFFKTRNLGYKKENVIILKNATFLGDKSVVFKENILKNPLLINASICSFLPVQPSKTICFFNLTENKKDPVLRAWLGCVDCDYIKTLGIKLIGGNNFSNNDGITERVIINRLTANRFGIKLNNKKYFKISLPSNHFLNVIGIVENFHADSLKNTIFPVVFFYSQFGDYILCRVESKNITSAVDFLKKTWVEFLPGQPFEYEFLDKSYYAQYENEQRLAKILGAFAFLAIFIACLGLFGLVTFVAEQRTKEIGIRKVLGASVSSIVKLLCKEFLILVAIANLIAWPIAYLIMNRWLNTFAYHVSFSPWIFIAAGLLSLIIAFLTVSYRAIKTALADPVKSLRYE